MLNPILYWTNIPEKHEVQGWKALLWGVPLSATKNASDWQRSSKRLITSGLLTFLHFFVKISAGKKSEASLGCSCMNDAFGCFWMPLDACSASKYIYMYTYVHIRMDENGFPYLKCIYINTSRYFLKIYQLYIHLYSSMSQETEATSARGAIWTSAGFSSEAGC